MESTPLDSFAVDSFYGAGQVIKQGIPHFKQILSERNGNSFDPFSDADEFELAKALNDMPFSHIRTLLELNWFKAKGGRSFQSGIDLHNCLGRLARPRMLWKTVAITPRSGTATKPVYLCYRNALKAIKSLFDCPLLANHLSYVPERQWTSREEVTRQYSEIFTGEWSWTAQTSIPFSSTLVPVLLCSGHPQLVGSGDKMVSPLYLSIGNIHSSIRNEPSANCWVLIAYLPIVSFIDGRELHHALRARLFHQCLKLIVATLKPAAESGTLIQDSLGAFRRCYPRIAAYMAPYPEQTIINVAPSSSSPVTTARYKQLGDAAPHPRRTTQWILSLIDQLQLQVDVDDVLAYKTTASNLGLSAVDQPFWEDFPGYEADLVISPDLLHGAQRMWREHILKWVRYLVGVKELDRRVNTLQPLAGIGQPTDEISGPPNSSKKQQKDLQKVLLAVIAGAPRIDEPVMRCLRAFYDFLYLSQYQIHSTMTLRYLQESLQMFHSLKNVFITNGARRSERGVLAHFNIQALSGLHMHAYHIPRMGTSPQFSLEAVEACLHPIPKAPDTAVCDHDFFLQMCLYLDRKAAVELTDEVWRFAQAGAHPWSLEGFSTIQRKRVEPDAEEAWEDERQFTGEYNRLLLPARPNRQHVPMKDLVWEYGLRCTTFDPCLAAFIAQHSSTESVVDVASAMRADAWYQCRVQQLSVQDQGVYTDARSIRAIPPCVTLTKHGFCNCALIREVDAGIDGIRGYRVAQVRMIFQLILPTSHPLHGVPLVYVYWFTLPLATPERGLDMFEVRYQLGSDRRRVGGIVKLDRLSRLVQLIPVYGPAVHVQLSATNSMDICPSYLINSFMDEETYQAVW